MKTNRVVLDQDGNRWLVGVGDPAWGLVSRLDRTSVVLPVETIVRGVVPHPDRVSEHLHRLATGFKTTEDEALREAYLRAVTLYDCLVELGPR